MASPAQQLPPGWAAEWDQNNQRYLFVETATGHTQWEVPQHDPEGPQNPPPAPHSKRRQYAAGQTQAYYGGDSALAPVAQGYDTQPHQQQQQPPSQLFTPALQAAEGQFAAQQQGGYYGGQQQEPHTPGFGREAVYQPAGVNALANQFGGMTVGQQGPRLSTVNLLTSPPEPQELHRPPPEIRLPPNATLSPSPHVNADVSYQRCTLGAIPTSNSVLSKTKIPFGLVITPYRSLKDGDEPLPLVTDMVIVRCRRCRAYINPYVQFLDNGNRWRCSLCYLTNEVPQLFDWDQAQNQPGDRWARAELNYGAVEYAAPVEYMVRPPQPPVYIFLIDVSYQAVQSGMVATATRTILENLDRLPNEDSRTHVAFIAFDVALHFFTLPAGEAEGTMLVVSDVDDVFIPRPTDLLVSLTESRAAIENLLGRFGDMFQENHVVGSALGPALQAAYKMMVHIGGKIVVLSSSLPTLGVGALKNREDPKVLGTSKESALLQSATPFYKTFAIECSRAQISVDMFLFSSGYQDVATLAGLPHYTAGQTYFYPAFNGARTEDVVKFAHEFGQVLAMPIMLEAVIRVRASKNLRMASFHGNFFVRSSDLLALPAVPQDQSYALEVQIEDTLTSPVVVFQTAVMHTTCFGERRIRVVTTAHPTTSSTSEIFASVDQVALATLLADKAVERALTHRLEDARDALVNKSVEILQAYKASLGMGGGAATQLAIPENMKMLPVLVLGLLRHVGLRQGAQVPPDLRAYAQALLTTLPSQLLIPYIYPTLYSLHNMAPECGTVVERGQVVMPPPLPPTAECLERHGLYLIEDGQTIFLWVGRDAVPQLVMDVFGLPAYNALRGGKTTLPLLENAFSQRVNAVVEGVRTMRRGVYHASLYVVKEDDGERALRMWALSCLVQDRADVLPGYQQFLAQLREKVNGYGN